MTPLERAARALCEAQGYPATPNEVARATDEVRAVLEAIREPSEAMYNAGDRHCSDGETCNPDSIWPAMIDAALAEEADA